MGSWEALLGPSHSCLSPQEDQPWPALLVGTLSPWPHPSSQLPASPGLLPPPTHPLILPHCTRVFPPRPRLKGVPNPPWGAGWGRWVPSGIISPPGTPLKLSKSLHPKPPHPSAVTPCCLLSALVCTLSSALSTSSFLLLSPLPEGHPTP